MKHAYCTYFDHNYLSRGLLMLQSLRSVDAETPIFVLALSDLAATVLRDCAPPGVVVMTLSRLEAEFPELLALKQERAGIDYVFTVKPFLTLHFFAESGAETLMYVDSDVHFYADPRAALDRLGAASIAITAHRFSADRLDLVKYGGFNSGWVVFRRDAEGMACLRQWADDCLAWCHDRVEDGRFGDQGFLDAWPERYPALAVVEHKGVNLAVWNVDNYTLDERDGQVTVDGEPLIFYHFHGIRLQPDGSLAIWWPERHGTAGTLLRHLLYAPYVARLIALRIDLLHRFPALAGAERPIRYVEAAELPRPPAAWRRRGQDWAPSGIDMRHDDAVTHGLVAALAEARHDAGAAANPALAAALTAAAGPRRRVSVLDWGGGVGLARVVAGRARPELELDWQVVDTPSRCRHGAAIHPQVRFETDPATLAGRRFDLVHAAGSIGVEQDWQGTLTRLRQCCGRVLLLDRVAVTGSEPSFVAEYHAEAWPAETVLTSWILNESALWAALASAGFTIEQRWPLGPLDPPLEATGAPYFLSLLCTVPAPSLITPIFRDR
jgi:putative methyltransferase (TIGR04325 family)